MFVVYKLQTGDSLLVEVDDREQADVGPQPVSRLSDTMEQIERSLNSSLESVCNFAGQIIENLKTKAPSHPDEVEVTFGIKALGEIQAFAVAKIATDATVTVRVKWNAHRVL